MEVKPRELCINTVIWQTFPINVWHCEPCKRDEKVPDFSKSKPIQV